MEDATERPMTAEDMAAIFTGPVEGRDYQEMPTSSPEPEPELDERFTHGLIFDMVKVLEGHGYRLPPVGEDGDATAHNRALGQTVGALLKLVRTYEGGDL